MACRFIQMASPMIRLHIIVAAPFLAASLPEHFPHQPSDPRWQCFANARAPTVSDADPSGRCGFSKALKRSSAEGGRASWTQPAVVRSPRHAATTRGPTPRSMDSKFARTSFSTERQSLTDRLSSNSVSPTSSCIFKVWFSISDKLRSCSTPNNSIAHEADRGKAPLWHHCKSVSATARGAQGSFEDNKTEQNLRGNLSSGVDKSPDASTAAIMPASR